MSAELTETQIITLLVDGLPPSMSSFFTTIKPSSMDEFYNIARQAETNVKLSEHAKIKTTRHEMKSSGSNFKRQAPIDPCKICEKRGKPNRMHWMSECFFNSKNKRPRLYETSNKPPNSKCLN